MAIFCFVDAGQYEDRQQSAKKPAQKKKVQVNYNPNPNPNTHPPWQNFGILKMPEQYTEKHIFGTIITLK